MTNTNECLGVNVRLCGMPLCIRLVLPQKVNETGYYFLRMTDQNIMLSTFNCDKFGVRYESLNTGSISVWDYTVCRSLSDGYNVIVYLSSKRYTYPNEKHFPVVLARHTSHVRKSRCLRTQRPIADRRCDCEIKAGELRRLDANKLKQTRYLDQHPL